MLLLGDLHFKPFFIFFSAYTERHLTVRRPVMPTGTTNNKSQQKTARVPLEVLSEMNLVKEENETDAQFIVTAMRG
ncbi:YlcI/YnfO family protein, partial [Escherichia coli]